MSFFFASRHTHFHKLVWDLDLDVTDTLTQLTIATPIRFAGEGEWTLEAHVKSARHLLFALQLSRADFAELGRGATPRWNLHWLDTVGKPHSILEDAAISARSGRYEGAVTPGDFHDEVEDSDEAFDPATQRQYRLEFQFQDPEKSFGARCHIKEESIANAVQPFLSVSRPDRVRLYFPRVDAEIWEDASFLSASSPYFKTLLESDSFAEDIRRNRKRTRAGNVAGEPSDQSPCKTTEGNAGGEEDPETTVDDSDEEVDDVMKELGLLRVEEQDDDDGFTYREIKITHASYSTYRAVLVWLHSSFIRFADLASAHSVSESRSQALRHLLKEDTNLPPRVSTKSVYRLAHLLELPELQAFALAGFSSHLSLDIAAVELFSDVSWLYDEVREIALDFVVENWNDTFQPVKESKGMAEIHRRLRAGEIPRAGPVLSELLKRL